MNRSMGECYSCKLQDTGPLMSHCFANASTAGAYDDGEFGRPLIRHEHPPGFGLHTVLPATCSAETDSRLKGLFDIVDCCSSMSSMYSSSSESVCSSSDSTRLGHPHHHSDSWKICAQEYLIEIEMH